MTPLPTVEENAIYQASLVAWSKMELNVFHLQGMKEKPQLAFIAGFAMGAGYGMQDLLNFQKSLENDS